MTTVDTPARAERGSRFRPALLWSYVLNTGGYAMTALMGFVLAAILDPRAFGVLAISMVFVTLAQSLLHHGPTMAVIQQDDITDEHINAAFWSTVAGATLFAGVIAATAPVWAALNRLPELVPVCLALAPIIVIQSMVVIPDAVLRRRMQMRGIALRSLIANLGSGAVGIGCALAGLGVWALVAQQLTAYLLYLVLLWTITPWRPRWGPIRGPLRDIRRTSVQTLASAVGYFAAARSDVLLMGAFFGPVVVGLYRFAARFADMVVDVTARGLQDVSLPALSRHGRDVAALAARFGRVVHAGAVLAFPALGILAAVADPLVRLIGAQWAPAAVPLRVLCLASAVASINALLGPALQAAGRTGLNAVFTWATAACSVTALTTSAVLSASWGTTGRLLAVACAALGVHTVCLLGMGYVTFCRILAMPVRPMLVAAAPAVTAALAAAASGLVLPALAGADVPPILALLGSGALAAAVAGIVLFGLDREARGQVLRLARSGSARLARRRRTALAVVPDSGRVDV